MFTNLTKISILLVCKLTRFIQFIDFNLYSTELHLWEPSPYICASGSLLGKNWDTW